MSFDLYLNLGLAETIDTVSAALKVEGRGILSGIDLHSTAGRKLDVDLREYVQQGDCALKFAWKAFKHDTRVGLLPG
ncbi:MAG: hypothetical protein P8N31_09440 [Planctomycetota bacterium]|nr:hypothetical protein [Planctomycetota bacterium]MDG2143766.1 hypothetical protein [Planctomycetota bacterium]